MWPTLRHYGTRRTTWVKLHTGLLRNDRYLALTATQRAALHGLWLLYAETSGRVPARTSWLSRQLGLRIARATLDALADAGFIAFRVDY